MRDDLVKMVLLTLIFIWFMCAVMFVLDRIGFV